MKVSGTIDLFSKAIVASIVMSNLASAAPSNPLYARDVAQSDSDDLFDVLVTCEDKGKDPSKRYAPPYLHSRFHEDCCVSSQDTPLSCSLTTNATCCYEGNNGIFMIAQFWDYNPATGPSDLFTTHGLWSNLCAGGYQQYCQPDWEVKNVTKALLDGGAHRLLSEMNRSWKNNAGSDEDLWFHEFNKHGTCMDTVNPSCYAPNSYKYQYVIDFFKSAVSLARTIPTYKFLNAAGITPSSEKQVAKADMLAAIKKSPFGQEVFLSCRNGVLQEVYYYFHLRGAVANGIFVPTKPPVSTGNCPDQIWYYPKGYPGAPQVLPSTSSQGKLNLSGATGCIDASGKWTSSTSNCGSFNVTNDGFGNLLISSPVGPCTITKTVLSCAAGNIGSQFTKDASGFIQYGGSNQWSSSSTPSGSDGVQVSSGSANSNAFKIKFDASS